MTLDKLTNLKVRRGTQAKHTPTRMMIASKTSTSRDLVVSTDSGGQALGRPMSTPVGVKSQEPATLSRGGDF